MKNENNSAQMIGFWLPIGAGIGTAMGVAFDNIAIGVALGPALGLLIGVIVSESKKPKNKTEE